MFSIRRTLIGLFVLLGIGLCALVTLETWNTFLQYREARELTASNSAREQLSRASMAIAEERTEAYLSLRGAAATEKAAAELRLLTDAVFNEAAETLAKVQDGEGLASLEDVRQGLVEIRQAVDSQQATLSEGNREASASDVFSRYSELVEALVTLRVSLLVQEHPADTGTANAFQLRRYSTVLLESLMQNEALIGGLLVAGSPAGEREVWDQIRGNAERAEVAFEFLRNRSEVGDRAVRLRLAALAVAYSDSYRPLEQDLLADLVSLTPTGSRIRSQAYRLLWSTRQITRTGAEFQESLFTYSRDRLAEQQRSAAMWAVLWVGMMALGLLIVGRGAWVVKNRVIEPLYQLRGSMLALAGGDLKAPLPQHQRADEIGAMADALRVFKANAARRARLQEERSRLYEKLQDAHRQVRKDLEAASAVQLSLLPKPARLGGVRFTGRLQPSHFISGDTYDVLRQPNGPVHFFLADVAGHGAAAALVSVASRYAAAQTILQRGAGDSLAEAMTSLNRNWPEHLPYFTIVLGELRPEVGTGVLVQAGHPPPVLVRKSGPVEMLGRGGLPIGVLREAAFDEVVFGFDSGDRLVIYSDGVSEAEDAAAQPFTEERVLDLLRTNRHLSSDELLSVIARAVQVWRGSETTEDDMTMLILEATDSWDEELQNAAE